MIVIPLRSVSMGPYDVLEQRPGRWGGWCGLQCRSSKTELAYFAYVCAHGLRLMSHVPSPGISIQSRNLLIFNSLIFKY